MKVSDKLSHAAILEQCAEECAELAQACLKLARKLRDENPTPKSKEKLIEGLMEELADATVCIDVMTEAGIFDDDSYNAIFDLIESKHIRWEERLEQHLKEKEN